MHKFDDTCVVILAAGFSKRMGKQNKLLLPIGGQALLRHAIDNFRRVDLKDIVVVIGYQHEDIAELLEGLKVSVVMNHDFASGQGSSVRCGLAAVRPNAQATFIALGDQPAVSSSTIMTMLKTFADNKEAEIVVPMFSGARGNPVLISANVRQQVLSRTSDYSCRDFIDDHPELVIKVELDDHGVVTDLDTPEDYQLYSLLNSIT